MAMTMLQMAGATPTPATMADGILLIIDAQREYMDGLMPLPGVQPAIEALAVLLEKARKAGAPRLCRHRPRQAAGVGQALVDDGLARKLAAILAADVVGYSRLMGRDESGSLGRLASIAGNVSSPAFASPLPRGYLSSQTSS
jgi:hypothetical protein